MRRPPRLILLALFVAAAPLLAGCENFDPDSLDIFHLNEKKKLPGERRELFPGGVPGVSQGVPPEYMKGYQPPSETASADDEKLPPAAKVNPGDEDAAAALKPEQKTAAVEPTEKPKPKKRKAKAKPAQQPAQVTIRAPAQGQQSPWPATNQQQQQQQAQSPWPAPPQNEAPSPWPAAPAPGTFSKQ